MKNNFTIAVIVFFFFFSSSTTYATKNSGKVSVKDKGTTEIFDPEHPDKVVDPGTKSSTNGSLRIDFVTSLNFGLANSNSESRKYLSEAQLFVDETPARGYFIQVSDFRDKDGWELLLTQKSQFKSSIIQDLDHQELNGAVLSFDNGWANTNGNGTAPLVTRDAVVLSNLNNAYSVAKAKEGEGKGSWAITFGASEDNPQQNTPTLKALYDNKKPVVSKDLEKQKFSNSAISLTVPAETLIYPVEYTTTLEWTLLSGP